MTEVRILQMGTTAYFQDLVMELCLVHDIDRIYGVDMQGLMNRNGEFPQVLILTLVISLCQTLCWRFGQGKILLGSVLKVM